VFSRDSVKFLGFVNGTQADPDKSEAILEITPPTDLKDL
jgi:hypothetical protein